jgi:ankyrin repeat protein
MSSPFTRPLPGRPDLAQQKKQAKELLDAFIAGEADAQARVRAVLPDKRRITLADAQLVLAREYGFANWAALRRHIDETRSSDARGAPEEQLADAFHNRDAAAVRALFGWHPQLRRRIDDPVFGFDSPAIVAYAGDLAMVEVLLEFGADPNRRSDWWAGGFHALHSATGPAAERLIAAGAAVDACGAANLDRPDLLARLVTDDPARVHERGGDGKTPLHFARSREVVDLLLAAGADVDARDVDHRSSPAEWMLDRRRGAGRYDLARYLVERGAAADVFLAAALGLRERAVSLVRDDPRLLDLRTGQGQYGEKPPSSYHIYFWTIGANLSPLNVAGQFGQLETLDAMLAVASPRHRLLFACHAGEEERARAVVRAHPGIIESLAPEEHRVIADAAWNGSARAVALMLELGFDAGATGHDSGTALHLAAWEGGVETVRVLLRHPVGGTLVSVKDRNYGATPLGWCCHGSLHGNQAHNHAGVARLLLDAGAPLEPDMKSSPAVQAVLDEARRRRTSSRRA